MKKSILLIALFALTAMASKAQNYMVVDSEKIFKSVAEYNNALETIEQRAQQYQKQIDDAFNELERQYNEYQGLKARLSQSQRDQREDAIIEREKEINRFQQEVFGQEGDLLKQRVELIKPIQDRVFNTINSYAQNNGFDLVMDIASNPSILYYSPSADKTDIIITLLR